MPNLPSPSLSATYVLALIVTIVGLFATQGWITNATSKFITGLAVVLVPLGLAVAHTLFHARVTAAHVTAAGKPARPVARSVPKA